MLSLVAARGITIFLTEEGYIRLSRQGKLNHLAFPFFLKMATVIRFILLPFPGFLLTPGQE